MARGVLAVMMRMVDVIRDGDNIIDKRSLAGGMGPKRSVKNELMYSNTPINDGCMMGPWPETREEPQTSW